MIPDICWGPIFVVRMETVICAASCYWVNGRPPRVTRRSMIGHQYISAQPQHPWSSSMNISSSESSIPKSILVAQNVGNVCIGCRRKCKMARGPLPDLGLGEPYKLIWKFEVGPKGRLKWLPWSGVVTVATCLAEPRLHRGMQNLCWLGNAEYIQIL